MSVYDEIIKERKRQDAKWGIQDHHPAVWLMILGEEYGEVCRHGLEAYTNHDDFSLYREELIHVAAVAVAAIESLERTEEER